MPDNQKASCLSIPIEEIRPLFMDLFYRANAKMLVLKSGDLLRNVNEQTICGSLCAQLEAVLANTPFSGYHVDVEYNRASNGKVKCAAIGGIAVPIRCDLLVHGEGTFDPDNLLCFEMKKAKRPEKEKEDDRHRLIALTTPAGDPSLYGLDGANPAVVCGYLMGIFYIYDSKKKEIQMEYYASGKLLYKESHSFSYFQAYGS